MKISTVLAIVGDFEEDCSVEDLFVLLNGSIFFEFVS